MSGMLSWGQDYPPAVVSNLAASFAYYKTGHNTASAVRNHVRRSGMLGPRLFGGVAAVKCPGQRQSVSRTGLHRASTCKLKAALYFIRASAIAQDPASWVVSGAKSTLAFSVSGLPAHFVTKNKVCQKYQQYFENQKSAVDKLRSGYLVRIVCFPGQLSPFTAMRSLRVGCSYLRPYLQIQATSASFWGPSDRRSGSKWLLPSKARPCCFANVSRKPFRCRRELPRQSGSSGDRHDTHSNGAKTKKKKKHVPVMNK